MTRSRETCRMLGCDQSPRGGGFAGRFCSTGCKLKFEHLRDDARDARRDALAEAREEDGL